MTSHLVFTYNATINRFLLTFFGTNNLIFIHSPQSIQCPTQTTDRSGLLLIYHIAKSLLCVELKICLLPKTRDPDRKRVVDYQATGAKNELNSLRLFYFNYSSRSFILKKQKQKTFPPGRQSQNELPVNPPNDSAEKEM